MRIKMYDVNFGEAIIYEVDNEKILVDCGSKCGRKGELAYERIENEIDETTKLIITHFDEDHYNGICEIPAGFHFAEINLPLYIYGNQLSSTMDFFIDTLRTWIYIGAIGRWNKIDPLHRLFVKLPHLVNSIRNIRCVGQGDSIFAGNKEFRVLWPEQNSGIRTRLYSNEILDILRRLVEERESLEAYIVMADRYVSLFIQIYQFYCDNMRDGTYPEINADNFHQSLKELDVLYNDLHEIQLAHNSNPRYINKINRISSTKIKGMNDCSIVFESDDNDIIAFGDVSKQIIKHLRDNHVFTYDKYKVLKVQHHGTKTYWSDDIPEAQVYLISNSGDKYRKWSIDERYGEQYSNKMLCTNNDYFRCQYYMNGGQRCPRCNIGGTQTEFVVDTNTL